MLDTINTPNPVNSVVNSAQVEPQKAPIAPVHNPAPNSAPIPSGQYPKSNNPPIPKQEDSSIDPVEKPKLSVFASFFVAATIIFVLGHIVFLFFWINNNSQIEKFTKEKNRLISDVRAMSAEDIRSRQIKAASTGLDGYFNKQVDWKLVWDEVNGKLLKRAQITSFSMDETGIVKISGETGTLSDLAKLLVSFQSSEKIKDIKLVSSSFTIKEGKTNVTFSLDGKFDLNKIKKELQ